MLIRIWAVVFAILIFFPGVSNAAFDKGGVSGIGARPLGMGGAFASVADTGDAVFYNPAGLVQVIRPEISGMGGRSHQDRAFPSASSRRIFPISGQHPASIRPP